jgi:hypothetical protein
MALSIEFEGARPPDVAAAPRSAIANLCPQWNVDADALLVRAVDLRNLNVDGPLDLPKPPF